MTTFFHKFGSHNFVDDYNIDKIKIGSDIIIDFNLAKYVEYVYNYSYINYVTRIIQSEQTEQSKWWLHKIKTFLDNAKQFDDCVQE